MTTSADARQVNANAGVVHASGLSSQAMQPGVLDQYSALFSRYTAQLVFRDRQRVASGTK
jgi:hypothetical protein